MDYQVIKLPAPYVVNKDTGELTSHGTPPEGHRFEMLKGKGEKGKAMCWYIVPDMSTQFLLEVACEQNGVPDDSSSKQVGAMLLDMLDKNQKLRLNEYDDGELAAKDYILDVAALASRYFIDGRSLGVKQEEIEEWIVKVLQPAMQQRIDGNMPSIPAERRKALVAALTFQFQIASTRSNAITVKGSIKSCTPPVLVDLRQRLDTYAADGIVDKMDDCFVAMRNRIEKHLGVKVEAVEVVETF